MKALTLTQPWATLVASGAKRVETRSWTTSHRGMIAIHAAKGFPLDARALCAREPFATALRRDGLGGLALLSPHKVLPRGVVVAIATLVDVVPTDGLWIPRLGLQEQAFGDYGPNRHAWLLDDVVRLPEPVPANGALGLWNLHVTAEALVVRALAATVS